MKKLEKEKRQKLEEEEQKLQQAEEEKNRLAKGTFCFYRQTTPQGVARLCPYKYIKHGHCPLIHGESLFFVTYSHGSGESNM